MNPKQRGLGRGLSALFEDEETDFPHTESASEPAESGNRRKILGISQLEANPDQPRSYFDDEALAELSESIREHGLLQPILVRPHKHKPDTYQIVAGERRWRASQIAQLHEVPVVIRELDDGEALQISLVENLQRQDLNPMEEARGYARLIEEFGHNQNDVGEAVGKSRSHVSNIMRLLQLPNSVQTMVSQGQLSPGHARALIGAKNPALLAQDVIARGLSVRQTEKLAAEEAASEGHARPGRTGGAGKPAKDTDTLALEKEIAAALGMNVSIDMKDTHAGTLTVSFRSLDQLDDVLRRLSQDPLRRF